MINKKLGVFLLITVLALSFAAASPEFGYNNIEKPALRPSINFSKLNVNNSNTTDSWNTNLGFLINVNSTQFSNNGGFLNIIESWVDSLWCRLTGCTMQGDINMNGNNIQEVNNLTATGNIEAGNFTLNDITINDWSELEDNISVNFGVNESNISQEIPFLLTNEGALKMAVTTTEGIIWQQIGTVISPVTGDGTINITGDGLNWIQGNLSVNSLEIRSPGSLCILVGGTEACFSAFNVTLGSANRIGVILNSDFGIQTPYNGTTYLVNINLDLGNTSNAITSANAGTGEGFSLVKYNPNFEESLLGILTNNKGDTQILNADNESTLIKIGWGTSVTRPEFTLERFVNRTFTAIFSINETNISNELNLGDNVNIDGNINQTNGNAFINNIYGYAKMKNLTGVVIDLISVGVYENITGINNGSVLNGVTWDNDHAFTINYSGIYEVSASVAFAGAAASEYNFDILVNGVEQNIFSLRQITTSNAEASMSLGPYAISLNEGDTLTIGISDGAIPVDPTVIGVQFGIRRIGL